MIQTTQDLFGFYDKVPSNLKILGLLRKHKLAEFVHPDTQSSVIFVQCGVKDLETVLSELSGDPGNPYHIDTENRTLNGMSFRADDVDGRTYYVLALASGLDTGFGISVLAHEAVHAAANILTDHRLTCDIEPGHPGEPLAYLVGALVEYGLKIFFPEIKSKDEDTVLAKALKHYSKKH